MSTNHTSNYNLNQWVKSNHVLIEEFNADNALRSHKSVFPVLKIGSRMVVPKEKFIQWVEEHTQGGTQ